ncbi:MAG: PIG-L family deacetylase, partial [Steroidobacteraceae bacterium]
MKQLLIKLLVRMLAPRRMQSLRALMRAAVIHNQRPVVCRPKAGKIAVLAPHMDDEVLGCGGTIARHVQAGAEVFVVFLTDGRHGSAAFVGLTEPERSRKQRELVETRKQEARCAGDVLGVKSITFLDAEDGRLSIDSMLPLRLRAILEVERPQLVYLPFFLENHTDHGAASDV